MKPDPLAADVRRAQQGDREALERVVAAIADDIYALAVRFLGHPADADDATQEALVRIVTGLGSFRGDSRFATWAYRVAANHLLNVKRALHRAELPVEQAHARLTAAVEASHAAAATDDPLVAEEMKLACAHGMLLCLDRPHRLAYVLGVLLELDGDTAAAVLAVSAPTYRKRLQRARQRMRDYLSPLCGLVSEDRPCRCPRMVGPASEAGIIDPARLAYASRPRAAERLHASTTRLQETTELLRGYPRYRAPRDLVPTLRRLLQRMDLN